MIIVNQEADELMMIIAMSLSKRNYYATLNSGKEVKLGMQHYTKGRFNRKKSTQLLKGKGDIRLDIEEPTMQDALIMLNKFKKKLRYRLNADHIQFFVGPNDKSNFRFNSAKTKPYKESREEKPKIIKELKQYLIDVEGAKVMHGYEADDGLGIYQTENTIASHIDKDISMIPGMHYNFMKDRVYEVIDPGKLWLQREGKDLRGAGIAFFYAQMLMGDKTDTIPPIPHKVYKSFGDKLAYDHLKDCITEQDYFNAVLSAYQSNVRGDWEERMLEQADLVWICREEGVKGSDYIRGRL